jgi:hypothetical protein
MRGIHPADLPVQVLTKFELVITHIQPSEQFNCWRKVLRTNQGRDRYGLGTPLEASPSSGLKPQGLSRPVRQAGARPAGR